jgi:hypothetical protein
MKELEADCYSVQNILFLDWLSKNLKIKYTQL